jgi:hypothetical protein
VCPFFVLFLASGLCDTSHWPRKEQKGHTSHWPRKEQKRQTRVGKSPYKILKSLAR